MARANRNVRCRFLSPGKRRGFPIISCCSHLDIYITYTPNSGLMIAVSVWERGKGRFRGRSEEAEGGRGSTEGARGSTMGHCKGAAG